MLSYTIRLNVTIKEYKEVPLAQRKVTLTPQNIEDAQRSSSSLWLGTTDQLPLLLRTMVLLEVEMQGVFGFHPTNRCEGLHKAIILCLIGSSTTRKSSNEHGFFIAVTFLSKIDEGRI